jgi:lysosomal Pro-X carboxypeptidase
MRVACSYLSLPNASLADLAHALGVLNNVSQTTKCYNATQPPSDPISMTFNLQVCTEVLPQSDFFASRGMPNDMFYAMAPWNGTRLAQYCASVYNITPRLGWIPLQFGLEKIQAASNIVFSNGEYDPWRTGGMTWQVSSTVVPLYIAEGAHHLDLMFSNPADPPSVVAARKVELSWIQEWISS